MNPNNYETEADYICDDQNNGIEESIDTDGIMDYQQDVLDSDDKLEAKLKKQDEAKAQAMEVKKQRKLQKNKKVVKKVMDKYLNKDPKHQDVAAIQA